MGESAASFTITDQAELYDLVNNWKRNINTSLESLIFSNYTDIDLGFGLGDCGIDSTNLTYVSIDNVIVASSIDLETFFF